MIAFEIINRNVVVVVNAVSSYNNCTIFIYNKFYMLLYVYANLNLCTKNVSNIIYYKDT